MARSIKAGVALRCDFCHKQISHNKVATQVTEGNCQGIFHGPICFQAAVENRKKLEKTI